MVECFCGKCKGLVQTLALCIQREGGRGLDDIDIKRFKIIIFPRKSNIQLLLYFRIQYCTQEIIIFREDLVNKMCRNCVRFPSSNLDIPTHVSSLLDKLPFVLYLFINLYI